MKEEYCYRAIGKVQSPYDSPEGTPIQPEGARGVTGSIQVFEDFQDGLEDLEGFSHIIVVYHFHLAKSGPLRVKPYMDEESHGIFATRSPARPNPLGLSVVRLKSIQDGVLCVENIDVLDETPVLDIKPHVARFDHPDIVSEGWLEGNVEKLEKSRDDGRFAS